MNQWRNAAAYYYCSRRDGKEVLPKAILVLNMDDAQAGLCICDSKGHITTKGVTSPHFREDPLDGLMEICHMSKADLWETFLQQETSMNKNLTRYHKTGLDRVACTINGVELSCSRLTDLFQPHQDAVRSMMQEVDPLLAAQGYQGEKLEQLSILMVGRSARLCLSVFTVKLHLNGHAYLPDPRMITNLKVPSESVIEAGAALYKQGLVEEKRLLGYPIRLRLLANPGDGGVQFHELASADVELEELDGKKQSPVFLVDRNIQLEVDGREQVVFVKGISQHAVTASLLYKDEEMNLVLTGLGGEQTVTPFTVSQEK